MPTVVSGKPASPVSTAEDKLGQIAYNRIAKIISTFDDQVLAV